MCVRGLWLRFFPAFVLATTVAQRALALDCTSVDRDGNPPPDGALVETQLSETPGTSTVTSTAIDPTTPADDSTRVATLSRRRLDD